MLKRELSQKFIIPRTKVGLGYGQLICFIFSLFKKLPREKSEDIINNFERQFAAAYNLPPGAVFNKARMAFYFLLKNLNLRPGGEVIISALHIADFINIINCAGFKPIVVDLNESTYCIDYQDLENKITDKTVLMCVTHLSGFAADMDRIMEISQKYNVPFIEDCSQALFSYYKEKKLGTFGRASIFSLSLLKPVITMAGGMVISKDEELLEKLRLENSQLTESSKLPLIREAVKYLVYKTATQKKVFRFFVFPLLRLFPAPFDFLSRYQRANKTTVLRKELPQSYFQKYTWQQAKLGLLRLETVKAREETRIKRAYYLYQHLTNPNVKKVKLLENSQALFWTFPVKVNNITHFKKYLVKNGIDSSGYLLSVVSDEPAFANFNFKTPVASDIKKHTLLLPIYPELTQEEAEYMVKIINQYAFFS